MRTATDSHPRRPTLDLFRPLVAALVLALVAILRLAATAAADEPSAVAAPPPAAAAASAMPEVDPGSLLLNGRQPLPGVLTGGQPSREQVAALANAGYKTLVNLRRAEESQPAVADLARELGMRYVELPIAGAQDLTPAKAAELGEVLANRAAAPVVIYCASGNRVGALLALEQAKVEGKRPEDALAVGLAAGLTRLEPNVRELLALPPG